MHHGHHGGGFGGGFHHHGHHGGFNQMGFNHHRHHGFGPGFGMGGAALTGAVAGAVVASAVARPRMQMQGPIASPQMPTAQVWAVQQPYGQQPYAQQPYVQQPYVQQPYADPDPPLGVTGVSMAAEGIFTVQGITYFMVNVFPHNGGNQWQVTKRYNDFYKLCGVLSHPAPTFPDAPFPQKHFIGFGGCDGPRLEGRRCGLQAWLNKTLQVQLGLSTLAKRWRRELRIFLDVDRNISLAAVPTAVLPHTQPTLPTAIGQAVPQPQWGASPPATPQAQPSALPNLAPVGSGARPDLRTDPEGWYKYHDRNNNGLEKYEVVQAVCHSFSGCDPRTVRDYIMSVWNQFNPDGSGTISLEEFLRKDGLRDAIVMQIGSPSQESNESEPSPAQRDLSANPDSKIALEIQIPPGVTAGECLQVAVPDGRQLMVTVPVGASAGATVQYEFDSTMGTLTCLG